MLESDLVDEPASPQELRNRVRRALAAVSESLSTASWPDARRHIVAYNTLLSHAYRQGVAPELTPIAQIPKPGTRTPPSLETIRAALLETKQSLVALSEVLAGGESTGSGELTSLSPAIERVATVCNRFHHVATSLSHHRRKGRSALAVKDEYDVQALLGALLLLDFEDVRSEETTCSHAGKFARMDFLIHPHGIVIETKMTRVGLDDKRIGDELLLDIARYRRHENCRALYCFVYDPDARLRNPRGLETDLTASGAQSLLVRVAVRP